LAGFEALLNECSNPQRHLQIRGALQEVSFGDKLLQYE